MNYNIVQINENGLYENMKNQNNKVLFKIAQDHNSPSNGLFLTSENNRIENNEIKNESIINKDFNNTDVIFVNNKIDNKIDKPLSLFFIKYNNTLNKYILTSLVDDVFLALEIKHNKNFYLDDSKRYYMQLCNVIITIMPNNTEKNVKIKILNSKDNKKTNNKYIFDNKQLPVKIGRKGCNININNNSISKVHLIVNYDKGINQFYAKDNNSTNGSLILLKKGKDIKLEDNMFFFLEKEHFLLKR